MRCSGSRRDWELRREMKAAALVRSTVHPDPAGHHSYEGSTDGESQAGPAVPARRGAVGLAERFENELMLLRRNADPRVNDAELQAGDSIRLADLSQFEHDV